MGFCKTYVQVRTELISNGHVKGMEEVIIYYVKTPIQKVWKENIDLKSMINMYIRV
jgi:hypothetical protein